MIVCFHSVRCHATQVIAPHSQKLQLRFRKMLSHLLPRFFHRQWQQRFARKCLVGSPELFRWWLDFHRNYEAEGVRIVNGIVGGHGSSFNSPHQSSAKTGSCKANKAATKMLPNNGSAIKLSKSVIIRVHPWFIFPNSATTPHAKTPIGVIDDSLGETRKLSAALGENATHPPLRRPSWGRASGAYLAFIHPLPSHHEGSVFGR